MQPVSTSNFGFLIAYLIPGAIILIAFEYSDGVLDVYSEAKTIGGLVFSTLLSLFLGMVASAARWLLIDTAHHMMGVKYGAWDFSKLNNSLSAYQDLQRISTNTTNSIRIQLSPELLPTHT